MANVELPQHEHNTRHAARLQQQIQSLELTDPGTDATDQANQSPDLPRHEQGNVSIPNGTEHFLPSQERPEVSSQDVTPQSSLEHLSTSHHDQERIQELERQLAVMQTALFTSQDNGHRVTGPSRPTSLLQPGPVQDPEQVQVAPLPVRRGTNTDRPTRPVSLDRSDAQTAPVNRFQNRWHSVERTTDVNRGDFSFLPNNDRPSRTSSGHTRVSTFSEPRMRLPEYSGSQEWSAFRMQFGFISRYYQWDEEIQLQQLVFCLRGDALAYVSQLPRTVQENLHALVSHLEKRYGDHILPETHRAALVNLKKQPKESLREYEARVRSLMSKAYPGMADTEMYRALEVEHLITGLPDPNMVFDILVRKPKTVREAINLIEWYECCRATQKRRGTVRQVHTSSMLDHYSATPEPPISFIGNVIQDKTQEKTQASRYVTEERLQKFGEDLRKGLVSDIHSTVTKALNNRSTGMSSTNANPIEQPKGRSDEISYKFRTQNMADKSKMACFNCHQIGHRYRECPLPRNNANLREILEELQEHSHQDGQLMHSEN